MPLVSAPGQKTVTVLALPHELDKRPTACTLSREATEQSLFKAIAGPMKTKAGMTKNANEEHARTTLMTVQWAKFQIIRKIKRWKHPITATAVNKVSFVASQLQV